MELREPHYATLPMKRWSSLDMTQSGRAWLTGFTATLTLAMVASSFMPFALGALAPFITVDLGLSRASFGALITTMFLVGSLASPMAGRLVDFFGGRRLLSALFAIAGVSFAAAAAAPTYILLLVAMVIGGFVPALGNPVTNKLVARHVSLEKHGVLIGVKQSGVQVGAFLAGAVFPSGALIFGWRGMLLASVLLPAIGLGNVLLFVPSDPPLHSEPDLNGESRLWAQVGWLVAYGFCMGVGLAALGAYLPLYAHESVGLSVSAAGMVAATVGLAGIVARITWGYAAASAANASQFLAMLAAGSAISQLMLWAASFSSSTLLWVGAIGIGASAGAWNGVGMLAIIREVGVREAGSASGLVGLAFFGGYVVAPVAFGYSLDISGSYDLGWGGVTLCYVAAIAIPVLRRVNPPMIPPTNGDEL